MYGEYDFQSLDDILKLDYDKCRSLIKIFDKCNGKLSLGAIKHTAQAVIEGIDTEISEEVQIAEKQFKYKAFAFYDIDNNGKEKSVPDQWMYVASVFYGNDCGTIGVKLSGVSISRCRSNITTNRVTHNVSFMDMKGFHTVVEITKEDFDKVHEYFFNERFFKQE